VLQGNALSAALLGALRDAFARLADDGTVRAVVVAGAGHPVAVAAQEKAVVHRRAPGAPLP
jgi:enoyl-CoA hydratase/carnithine racemase